MRALLVFVAFSLTLARADVIECSNGDRYNGTVLLVDQQNVRLTNEITGLLVIPRPKVSSISFATSKSAALAIPAPAPISSSFPTNILSPSKPLKIDSAAVEQVQNQLLGDASPEATQMFQDMVRGLLSGKIDVSDVRTKAQSTLDQLKDLQKDLGDDDATLLLNSYASLLQNFINQAPASTNRTEPKPTQ